MENEIKDSRGDAERQRAQSETLVDIVAEMRSIAKPGETFEHTYELLCGFADRIEAAYKRDIEKLSSVIQATVSRSDAEIDRLRREAEELRKKLGNEYPSSEASPRSGCPGNGAKLREAIKSLMDNLQIHAMMPCEQITMNRAEVCAMIEDCRAALAAPARNCDVGTAKEQARRWEEFCTHHHKKMIGNKIPVGPCECPCYEGNSCNYFIWAQMPYTESEAGK